jgi:glycosyltransferase involved in cell wall biosynthesis
VRKTIAFIVQRAAVDIDGGAEYLCLQLARHLAQHCNIEILTTRAKNYTTWEDWHSADPELLEEGRVIIRRFPVDRTRDITAFNQLCQAYEPIAAELSGDDAQRWLDAQGPNVGSLIDYLIEHINQYHQVVCFSYLYETSHRALTAVHKIAPHKTVLVPFAHHEWPLKMPIWNEIFARATKIVFSTEEERLLLTQRFTGHLKQGVLDGPVITTSAELDPQASAQRFRDYLKTCFGYSGDFYLYLGRVDPAKGIDELLAFYERALLRYETAGHDRDSFPALVLAGKPYMALPVSDAKGKVFELGYVGELTKWDALLACRALITASRMESLSIVALEAFAARKPVLVSSHCAVLAGHVKRSLGGFAYSSFDEFYEALMLLNQPAVLAERGSRGNEHFMRHHTWERVTQQYCELLDV